MGTTSLCWSEWPLFRLVRFGLAKCSAAVLAMVGGVSEMSLMGPVPGRVRLGAAALHRHLRG